MCELKPLEAAPVTLLCPAVTSRAGVEVNTNPGETRKQSGLSDSQHLTGPGRHYPASYSIVLIFRWRLLRATLETIETSPGMSKVTSICSSQPQTVSGSELSVHSSILPYRVGY